MLRDDLRCALRSLARRPAFTGTAVAVLALGIGATTAMFSIVDAALLRPPPFPDAARLAMLYLTSSAPGRGVERQRWSFARFDLLRRSAVSFIDMATFGPANFNLAGDEPERVSGEEVSASYFHTLGVGAWLGRTFVAAEDSGSGARPVAVISFGLWTRRFGADPAIVGRTIRLNDVDLSVVGVMPREFSGLTGHADLWVPSAMAPLLTYRDYRTTNQDFISVIARLAPRVLLPGARAEMAVLGARIERVRPSDVDVPTVFSATAVPLSEARVNPGNQRAMLLLFMAVGFLLLIACANVASLELARNTARAREIAVRLAIGATRRHIVRFLLVESAVLSLAGGALGAVLAAATPGLAPLPPDIAVPANEYGALSQFAAPAMSGGVLAFAAAVVVAVTLISGALPAATASRCDVTLALKRGPGGTPPGRWLLGRWRLRSALVIGEIATAFALASGALHVTGALRRLETSPLGFDPRHVITFRVEPPDMRYPPSAAPVLIERALGAIGAVPGVEAATVDACAPLAARCANSTLYVVGRPVPAPGLAPGVLRHYVGPDHFRALRVPMIRGRAFTPADRAGRPRVAIINATAARRFWPGQDPIGQRVWFGGGSSFDRPDSSAEIVGVAGDVPYALAEGSDVPPSFYTPYLQFTYASRLFMVRASGDPQALVPALRRAVRSADPALPIFDVRSLTDRVADAWSRTRFTAHLLAAFAALAAVLAAAGIYGIMAQSVSEREREMGIRIALGGSARRIARLVVGESMTLTGIGLTIGIGVAAALGRVMSAVLAEVRPADPGLLAALAVAAGAVALLASWAPAGRAARANPAVTMRAE